MTDGASPGARVDVEFADHEGVTLRGWLFAGSGTAAAPGPALVMAHGFSATKEMALDRFAAVFAAAGVTVLAYDHRCLGASDGEPRQLVDPYLQARGYRAALDWLCARPEVDAGRVGIWGSSFSGGEVLVVGAVDRRVRAVVANVPLAGFPGVDYTDAASVAERFDALRVALDDPAGPGTAGSPVDPAGPLAPVHAPGNELHVVMPQPESTEWFLRAGGEGTNWENRIFLGGTPEGAPAFDPGVAAAHLAPTPLLMVVASDDTLAATDVALATFERAGAPKQLELVEGHHFVDYDGESFTHVARVMTDFLTQYL
ncbi:MAG: alpha/beta hydrolase [Acidimicrobiia bacterium]